MYNTAAYVLAVINSYLWNSRITFSRKANFGWREKISFALPAGSRRQQRCISAWHSRTSLYHLVGFTAEDRV